MRLQNTVAFALFLALSSAAALAQSEPSSSSSADIVVTADQLTEQAERFATEISEAPQAEDQFARWNNRICPGAVGLAPGTAQTLVDRISARAQAIGLQPGEPGCRANVMVIFAPDSDALSREIVDRRRDLLGYHQDEGMITAGRGALEAFATTPRAVRWWHIAQTTTSDGRALGNSAARNRPNPRSATAANGAGNNRELMDAVISNTTFDDLEGVRSSGSRTRRETRQDLNYVLIVVDARRVADVPASAWMDYVALVSLAQINPDVRPTAAPSILSLFVEGAQSPSEMTAWDAAYLDGLYRAPRTALSARQQIRDIAERVADSVSPPR